MTDNIGTIIEDQFTRLLEQHVDNDSLQAAEGTPMASALWTAVEDAGLPLALVPEDAGGIGLDAVSAFRLIALAGQHALPLPLGETIVTAGLLGRPLAGAAGLSEIRDGTARSVAWGADVAHILSVDAEGWRLVPATDLSAKRSQNIAGEARDTLQIAQDSGESVAIPNWLAIGDLKAAGALVRTAQMCGAMRRAVDLSVSHATDRYQFGRPIAKFQAVQHMLADAAGQLAASMALLDNAAESWGRESFAFRSALAKIRAGSAAAKVAEVAHQVHAAMGFTREHPLHFYTRRLWSWRDEFGTERYWQRLVGQRVCAAGGDALWATVVEATSQAKI